MYNRPVTIRENEPTLPVPPVTADGHAPDESGGDGPLKRFLAERERRAENRKHRGEKGRCLVCGDNCGTWSKCKSCRMKQYEDDARCGPPLGEHWPTPPAKPLPDLIDETPINNSEVPWE